MIAAGERRYAVPAVVLVWSTAAASSRRQMADGAFQDIHPVDHAALARSFGFRHAVQVEDEPSLWQVCALRCGGCGR